MLDLFLNYFSRCNNCNLEWKKLTDDEKIKLRAIRSKNGTIMKNIAINLFLIEPILSFIKESNVLFVAF